MPTRIPKARGIYRNKKRIGEISKNSLIAESCGKYLRHESYFRLGNSVRIDA